MGIRGGRGGPCCSRYNVCSEFGWDFLRVVVAEIGCGMERFFAKEGGSEEVCDS